MPVLNDNPLGPIRRDFNRGNLIVRFDIQFPHKLTEQQRQDVAKVLDEAELNQ
jgi:hypothetical protein